MCRKCLTLFLDVCFVQAVWLRLSGTALSFLLKVRSWGFSGYTAPEVRIFLENTW